MFHYYLNQILSYHPHRIHNLQNHHWLNSKFHILIQIYQAKHHQLHPPHQFDHRHHYQCHQSSVLHFHLYLYLYLRQYHHHHHYQYHQYIFFRHRHNLNHKELYHCQEIGECLDKLDSIEGFLGYGSDSSLFTRIVTRVHDDDNSVWAWTYKYNGDSGTPIKSGDWRVRG